jgi:two-component sensor histidine kinase
VARHVRTYLGRADRVRLARDELRRFLARNGVTGEKADAGILIASELSANSVLHSRSGKPDEGFTVSAEVHAGYLYLEVTDAGGRWGDPAEDDGRPHGLDLVRLLAGDDNLGVDGDSAGHTVWVRLDLPRGGGQ